MNLAIFKSEIFSDVDVQDLGDYGLEISDITIMQGTDSIALDAGQQKELMLFLAARHDCKLMSLVPEVKNNG